MNFHRMVKNCFRGRLSYSSIKWFRSLIARLRVVLFWIQNILATFQMVLQLDQNYSSRRVESNFVAGFKNSFSVGCRVGFFGVLRFPWSMRSVVSGSLLIETVFHVYVTISNNTILLCMLFTNKSK